MFSILRIKTGMLFFLIIFAFLLFVMVPFFPHLVVLDGQTNKLLFHHTVHTGQTFEIQYIHSIHLTPVNEFYQINDELNIVLNEVHFDTYGVGMPSDLSEGETLELKNGKMMIKNMRRILPSIDLRIGQVIANHQLIMNSQKIPFSSIAPPGSWVHIEVKKLSIIELWGRAKF